MPNEGKNENEYACLCARIRGMNRLRYEFLLTNKTIEQGKL
jgi:hypothetical protein